MFDGLWYDCNGYETATSIDQCECEQECSLHLQPLELLSRKHIRNLKEEELVGDDGQFKLLRRLHVMYLRGGLGILPSGFVSLDSSRPWICYW